MSIISFYLKTYSVNAYSGYELNLTDITIKFRTIDVLMTLDLKTVFYKKYLGTYMIYLHTKFHTPSSIRSLDIVIKPKAKEKFLTVVIYYFIFYENYF
jgi:hypothetical protein